MEQPLDFSKSTIKSPTFAAKKMQRFNTPKSLKNFTTTEYHVHNSENSDENTSRSSASSPDSVQNEQSTLNSGQNTFSQQALLMLAVSNMMNQQPQFNSTFATNLNTSNQQPSFNTFAIQPNQQFNSTFAAHLNSSNQQPPPQQSNSKQSKSNQTKASKSSGQKVLSRKSMIMAKQQEEDEHKINKSATKFGILSNSQNSNILQIDADIESDSQSPLLNSSLQISINSNMSGEENSLYGDMYSQDGDSPKSRRRGNPIPESLKDDSYWVRRKKNNEAAKKSRDAKRAKDLITAKRAVLLENENSSLKSQLDQMKSENLILRSILGEEALYDENEKQHIDELVAVGRKVNPEKVRSFAQEFFKIFGVHQERMES